MREDRNATRPGDAPTPPRGCERAEELITYLYGESTPEEARVFRRHLDACAVCREELTAFGGVREAVGGWHAEALGAVPSLNVREALAPAAAPRRSEAGAGRRKRSAAAALREFFSLSPLWLRAGAAACVLAFCALAALTLARAEVRWDSNGLAIRAGAAERVVVERVPEPARGGYTEEQLDAAVAERLDEAKALWEAERQRAGVLNVSGETPKRTAPRAAERANAPRARRTAPRARVRDEESADLPRLSDLLNGSF